MPLKYICAGLSRTGTTSFHNAMEKLGFKSIHHDTKRLWDVVCGINSEPDFKLYDDIDVISDLPAPIYLSELMEAYPSAKVILTIRDINSWWKSIERRFNRKAVRDVSFVGKLAKSLGFSSWPGKRFDDKRLFKNATRRLAYGSARACEFNYKRRYKQHNQFVMETVPKDKLLVMNICEGDEWDVLCPFVGRSVPQDSFPRSNSH